MKALPVVHKVADESWPTREEAERAMLFSEVELGPRVARRRTWVPAMVPWRATEEGMVTEQVIEWYARFARAKPGVIVIEATGVRDVASGPLLRIGHDRFVDGLSRLVDAVREASEGETLLFVQLIDFLSIRRRPEREKFFARFLEVTRAHRERLAERDGDPAWIDRDERDVRAALSAMNDDSLRKTLTERELEALEYGHRERVTDTHLPHVRALPEVLPSLFASAAARAERAGFDGVELHYAHAYTMASFLSARNTRDDGYGTTFEGRVRLPLEVLAAVRAGLSSRAVLGLRMLGDEAIDGGTRIRDASRFAVEFAKHGAHFISVSKGGKFEDAKQPKVGHAAYPYTGPSGHECMPTVRSDERGPFGRNLELSRSIRAALRGQGLSVPVVGAGGINGFRLAERALAEGDCDVVASARQSLADPDWFAKVLRGEGATVRRCKFTNYCEALDQHHKEVTCQLWDKIREGDPELPPHRISADGRRRLIAP
ncbi:MAG: NADH:flavin oxidoreductase [Myxococcales bacterium]|nr:NADH:flavin oxidoreductase [Myxococcales bacterium]